MPDFPPVNPDGLQNIFKVSYWKSLTQPLQGGVGVADRNFWDAHPEAAEVNSWKDLMPVLKEIDTALRKDSVANEPQLYIYKTKGEQDLRNIHDWYGLGGMEAFRKYIYQKKYEGKEDDGISADLNGNKLISPLGGHVGHLQAILDHQQNGPAILRFKMRRGAYSVLFRASGRLAFGNAAASLRHVARYFRQRAGTQYLVTKKTVGGAGEGYEPGWLGVKGEDEYVSFAIGDSGMSKALFSILVSKCEWHTQPRGQTVGNYDTWVW